MIGTSLITSLVGPIKLMGGKRNDHEMHFGHPTDVGGSMIAIIEYTNVLDLQAFGSLDHNPEERETRNHGIQHGNSCINHQHVGI